MRPGRVPRDTPALADSLSIRLFPTSLRPRWRARAPSRGRTHGHPHLSRLTATAGCNLVIQPNLYITSFTLSPAVSVTGVNSATVILQAPAGDDYHLRRGSPARNLGLNAGATTDVDGDTRRMRAASMLASTSIARRPRWVSATLTP